MNSISLGLQMDIPQLLDLNQPEMESLPMVNKSYLASLDNSVNMLQTAFQNAISVEQSAIDDLRRRQREQQRAADNFRRLRDIAFRRSASAQRRAKGGAMVKPKDYVNPSSTIDRRKKK